MKNIQNDHVFSQNKIKNAREEHLYKNRELVIKMFTY